jgi:cytochrome P450
MVAPLPPTVPGHWLLGSGPAHRRRPLELYAGAARDFGDVVRFRGLPGMAWYLVSSPAGAEQVLKTRQKAFPKSRRFLKALRPLLGHGLLVEEGESWLRNRRLMQPVFHRHRLAAFANEMADAASEIADAWGEAARAGRPVDVAPSMLRATLRIVGRTLFSTDLSVASARLGGVVRTTFEHANRKVSFPFTIPDRIPTPRNRRFLAARATLDEIVYGLIAERRRAGERARAGSGGADLLGMLLDACDAETGERMSERQVRDEALTLMLAGHETTAAALAWTWDLLARNADAARLMRTELDRVLGGRRPTADDVPRLPYTRAVVDETLRLFPPAWVIPRRAAAEETIDGRRLPDGSLVLVSPWVTQRREDVWSEPTRFRPERFLPGGEAATAPAFAYYPFGGGARQCIGNHFALMEAVIVLATIAQRVELHATGTPPVPDPTFTMRPRGPLPMRPTLRTPTAPLVPA